jgi:hypothetical protein
MKPQLRQHQLFGQGVRCEIQDQPRKQDTGRGGSYKRTSADASM